MKNEYFNMICQKAPGGKMIMMAVVPDDLLCVSIHASVKDATWPRLYFLHKIVLTGICVGQTK